MNIAWSRSLAPGGSMVRKGTAVSSRGGIAAAPATAAARAEVAAALALVSAQPDAPELLGVSANLHADIRHNTRLGSAPAVPVADLYTGVLYDALGLPSMDTAARRRANRWIVVVSALFGAVRPTDKAPPYRLSMLSLIHI